MIVTTTIISIKVTPASLVGPALLGCRRASARRSALAKLERSLA
jgi:hypothetical protein